MDETYILRGHGQSLALSEMEVAMLRRMRDILSYGLAIEEAYDLVIANFVDLEKEHLDIAIEHEVRPFTDYGGMGHSRGRLDRRLLNFLSAARFYHDHLNRRLAQLKKTEKCDVAVVEKARAKCREECWEYRFMEALRNHVQHCSTPIHTISLESWRVGDIRAESQPMAFAVGFVADPEQIRDASKRAGEQELDAMDGQVDLKAAARVYLSCIGKIHAQVRAVTGPLLKTARDHVAGVIQRFKEDAQPDVVGLAVVAISPDGKHNREFGVSLNWDDVRIALETRNGDMRWISTAFVTGEPMPKREPAKW
jgi:hypothetical protein